MKLDYLIKDPYTETWPSQTLRAGRGGLRFLVRVRVRVRVCFFPETQYFHRVIPRCKLV